MACFREVAWLDILVRMSETVLTRSGQSLGCRGAAARGGECVVFLVDAASKHGCFLPLCLVTRCFRDVAWLDIVVYMSEMGLTRSRQALGCRGAAARGVCVFFLVDAASKHGCFLPLCLVTRCFREVAWLDIVV